MEDKIFMTELNYYYKFYRKKKIIQFYIGWYLFRKGSEYENLIVLTLVINSTKDKRPLSKYDVGKETQSPHILMVSTQSVDKCRWHDKN